MKRKTNLKNAVYGIVLLAFTASVIAIGPEEQLEARKKALEKAKAKLEKQLVDIELPADATPRLTVRELQISGNTLISTDKLLKKMPLIYNASGKPLKEADSQLLYDFRVLHDILVEPGTPQQVSSRTAQGLTQYILSMYQKKDYAGIYVYVPGGVLERGAELESGVLNVNVIEAEVADVSVTLYDANQNQVEQGYIDVNTVLSWSPAKTGKVANQKKVDDFVGLLNLNPDRYASAVVTSGPEPNTLAVNYDIYEAAPWHYFIYVDNSGTDDRQWNPRIGAVNTNLLGRDDSFMAVYQMPLESDWDDNHSLYGSYDFPLSGPGLRLNVYGGYSEFDVSPEASDIDFFGGGKFIGGILRWNVLQTGGWFFDLTGSVSHEESKITSSLAELFPGIGRSDVTMDLWGLGFDIHRRTDMSRSRLSFKRTQSMKASDLSEFIAARAASEPYFSISTLAASHSQHLDPNKVTRLNTTVKWVTTEDRLVPAKMTLFGGMYSVRGYDEYEVVADGGVLASTQYEFDLIRHEKTKGVQRLEEEEEEQHADDWELKKLAPLAFFDFGRSRIKDPIGAEKGHTTFVSVGVGTLVELGDNLSSGVYYGFPLKATEDTRRGKGRLNVGIMARW